jgi:hypothetical protein
MDHPFEGIPTIPPRKDTAHMAFYCNGCRYRVAATPDMTVAQVACNWPALLPAASLNMTCCCMMPHQAFAAYCLPAQHCQPGNSTHWLRTCASEVAPHLPLAWLCMVQAAACRHLRQSTTSCPDLSEQ